MPDDLDAAARPSDLVVEAWNLELIWCLDVGVWNFRHCAAAALCWCEEVLLFIWLMLLCFLFY